MDDVPLESNGPAYQRREVREGPPLDYVAEKLRASLESLHALTQAADADVACQARIAFHYGVVSYLALKNMLAASNAPFFSERLAAMPSTAFEQWLDAIDAGGSVTGLAL